MTNDLDKYYSSRARGPIPESRVRVSDPLYRRDGTTRRIPKTGEITLPPARPVFVLKIGVSGVGDDHLIFVPTRLFVRGYDPSPRTTFSTIYTGMQVPEFQSPLYVN